MLHTKKKHILCANIPGQSNLPLTIASNKPNKKIVYFVIC